MVHMPNYRQHSFLITVLKLARGRMMLYDSDLTQNAWFLSST